MGQQVNEVGMEEVKCTEEIALYWECPGCGNNNVTIAERPGLINFETCEVCKVIFKLTTDNK